MAWAGPAGLRFDKCLDSGQTWLENDILIDPMPTGWNYSIPGIYRSNGLPITKCDLSNGPIAGQYMLTGLTNAKELPIPKYSLQNLPMVETLGPAQNW